MEPEWRTRLTAELDKDRKANIYSLGTVESQLSTGSFRPRSRCIVHRSFLPLKAPKLESGTVILQATTDIRSAKSYQIHEQSTSNAAEVLWWFPTSKVQFRLQCRAYLLPSPSHQWRRDFPEDLAGKADDIDWEAERINCFNGLSSFLRASFARPAPGSELSDPELAKKWLNELPKIGEEENEKQKELVQQAFQNFAVLYLEVDEVDFVDLGVVPNERHLFRREANDWVKTMLVP